MFKENHPTYAPLIDFDRIKWNKQPDRLFQDHHFPKPFEFNQAVANVFDDMIIRSIPLYKDVLHALTYWTTQFYQPGTTIYDIGCSTGSAIALMAANLAQPAHIVGIDTSESMLKRARTKLESFRHHQIELINTNAVEFSYSNASIVVLNYTLTFIPVKHRVQLLKRVYQGLHPGGLLFISDKIRSQHPVFQDIITFSYEAFKEKQGYTRTEIERKKEALENVLTCLDYQQEIDLLTQAGFTDFETILKWNNFVTIVAVKQPDQSTNHV